MVLEVGGLFDVLHLVGPEHLELLLLLVEVLLVGEGSIAWVSWGRDSGCRRLGSHQRSVLEWDITKIVMLLLRLVHFEF